MRAKGRPAKRTLSALALVLTLGGPALAQAPDRPAPPSPDRSAPPLPGPAPRMTLPSVQKHALANGLEVWIIERHAVPMVNLTLVVKSGSAADPAGKFGLASLTSAMLTEPAAARGALVRCWLPWVGCVAKAMVLPRQPQRRARTRLIIVTSIATTREYWEAA